MVVGWAACSLTGVSSVERPEHERSKLVKEEQMTEVYLFKAVYIAGTEMYMQYGYLQMVSW